MSERNALLPTEPDTVRRMGGNNQGSLRAPSSQRHREHGQEMLKKHTYVALWERLGGNAWKRVFVGTVLRRGLYSGRRNHGTVFFYVACVGHFTHSLRKRGRGTFSVCKRQTVRRGYSGEQAG
jgi:hypothetical protein